VNYVEAREANWTRFTRKMRRCLGAHSGDHTAEAVQDIFRRQEALIVVGSGPRFTNRSVCKVCGATAMDEGEGVKGRLPDDSPDTLYSLRAPDDEL
jgi:hypothetical protein